MSKPYINTRIYLQTKPEDPRLLAVEFVEMPMSSMKDDFWRLIDLNTGTVYCTSVILHDVIHEASEEYGDHEWNYIPDKDDNYMEFPGSDA